MCHNGFQIFGGGVLGGAQADLLAVPAADFQLLTMPEGISTEQALLLTDNLATGWAAAQRADIPYGGTVAVIGLGAVGLCSLRSALFQGAPQRFSRSIRSTGGSSAPPGGERRPSRRRRSTPFSPPPGAAAPTR
jgi:threonine dehydrogenase-like Zn-dependent dehydrogenase